MKILAKEAKMILKNNKKRKIIIKFLRKLKNNKLK